MRNRVPYLRYIRQRLLRCVYNECWLSGSRNGSWTGNSRTGGGLREARSNLRRISPLGISASEISIRLATFNPSQCRNSTLTARMPLTRAQSTAAASAPNSCTSPIASAAIGSRSAWSPNRPQPDRARILERLVRAEIFEQVLQTRYLGTKRYSLEGNASLIPLLDEVLDAAADLGARARRDRHEPSRPAECDGSHCGPRRRRGFRALRGCRPAQRSRQRRREISPRRHRRIPYAANGRTISTCISVSNPSHLEAVDPVAMGRTRAKQTRSERSGGSAVIPDSPSWRRRFCRSGHLGRDAELSRHSRAYNVGGSIHIIVNNLIGFTTVPRESHFLAFSSDLAKRIPIPIFHVNAEDPDAVVARRPHGH